MLGWSIEIKRNDENGEKILYAESLDISLDRRIRERSEKVLFSADYPAWGYGYPNRYLIRNELLPRVELYQLIAVPGERTGRFDSRVLTLEPFPSIPAGEVLWVEVWDQS